MSERVVEVKNLVAGYLPGVNILNGVNFYADKGELIGIIGKWCRKVNTAESNLWSGKSSRRINHSQWREHRRSQGQSTGNQRSWVYPTNEQRFPFAHH